MKERLRRSLVLYLSVLAAGIAYYFICTRLGIWIPCPFNTVTGFDCPGCGISMMIIHLLKGEFDLALKANRVLPFVLPVIVAIVVCSEYRYIRYGTRRESRAERVICIAVLAVLLTYGVIRNIFPETL